MLDQKLAEAMQRILSKGGNRFDASAILERLVENGIGTKRGKSIYFTENDRNEMRSWLNAKGFATTQTDLSGLSRGDRLEVTPNEKASGEAVKRNRVSIKALAEQPLAVNGRVLNLPVETHLDADWTTIAGHIGHRCVMVVENYESFNLIHETEFSLPAPFQSPLVVYRGDPHESRIDNVLQLLDELQLPVLAFVDADPAGIAIAFRLPGLAGMITPELAVLEKQLASPRTGRRDLFQNQYSSVRNVLDGLSSDSPCRPVLDLILHHRSGVVQERWIGRDICTLINGRPESPKELKCKPKDSISIRHVRQKR